MWPFKKKGGKSSEENYEEDIPELPELPPLPDLGLEKTNLPEIKTRNELPLLPSFPNSETGEKISREAVKQAVREPFTSFPKPPRKPLTRELEEREFVPVKQFVKEAYPTIKTEPVFIRIDKYQEAFSKFQEIKKQVTEIEYLLSNTKDIKAREEAELQSWQQEIQAAKEKLDSIDKLIFKKLEE